MNRTTFSFRIDRWGHDGNTIMLHRRYAPV
jgi:hypothetical protein